MILNKSVIIEHFINGTKKALGLLSYIVFNKKILIQFAFCSLSSLAPITAIVVLKYELDILGLPSISLHIVFLCLNFIVICTLYYLFYRKSYNKAHIFDLGKKDLREYPIIWSRAYIFQLLFIIGSVKYHSLDVIYFWLLYIVSHLMVYLMYVASNVIIRNKANDSGKSLFVPSLSDFDKELDPDRYFIKQHKVEGKHRVIKKLINNELRNTIYCRAVRTKILFNKPILSSLLEISIASDSTIKRDSVVEILFDDCTVLKKRTSLLHKGWNDFRGLSNICKHSKINQITVKIEKGVDIYFTYKTKTIIKKDEQKNIIVLLIDGLRKDSVGLYNLNQATPSIDGFFSDYTKYENAYVQGEWTLPSFASMATSLYSSHHRVMHPDYSMTPQLPKEINTYLEQLQEKGYHTYYHAGAPRASHLFGYQRGVDRFSYQKDNKNSESIILNAINFLNTNEEVNKYIFLHLMDLRTPIRLKSPMCWDNLSLVNKSDLEILNNSNSTEDRSFTKMYNNKVIDLDSVLSLLFDKVENSHLKSNTSVILTSDHGINLPTDSVINWKEKQFSDERMIVPLLLRCPWKPESFNKTYSEKVEVSIDLYPTLLELSEAKGPSSAYSKSFLPNHEGTYQGKSFVISEMFYKDRYDCRILNDEFEYYKRFHTKGNGKTEEMLIEINEGASIDKSDTRYSDIIDRFRSIIADLQLLSNEDDVSKPFSSLSSYINL